MFISGNNRHFCIMCMINFAMTGNATRNSYLVPSCYIVAKIPKNVWSIDLLYIFHVISRKCFGQVILLFSIGLMGRVFATGPGDWGSIPGRVIPKPQKMVLDASLLNTHHYMARIKGKVEQYREKSSALSYTSV